MTELRLFLDMKRSRIIENTRWQKAMLSLAPRLVLFNFKESSWVVGGEQCKWLAFFFLILGLGLTAPSLRYNQPHLFAMTVTHVRATHAPFPDFNSPETTLAKNNCSRKKNRAQLKDRPEIGIRFFRDPHRLLLRRCQAQPKNSNDAKRRALANLHKLILECKPCNI